MGGRCFRTPTTSARMDDQVVILGGCAVRGRGSGAISDNPMAWVLTFRDGKVLRHRAYRSREEALDAVGLAA